MWLILQQKKPQDFVIATGKQYTVRDFAKEAFNCIGLDYRKFVKVNKKFIRPSEVDTLLGNPTRAKKILNWKPKVNFKQLVEDMVSADLEFVKKQGY